QGYIDLVKLLIENGIDINYKCNDGRTALLLAFKYDHFEIAKYLIEKGADISNKKTDGLMTPLMYASKNGNIELVKYLLIEKGNNVSYVGSYDFKLPVMLAYENKHFDIVRYLVEKGTKIPLLNDFYSEDMSNDFWFALYKSFNNKDSSSIRNINYIKYNKKHITKQLYNWKLNNKNNQLWFMDPKLIKDNVTKFVIKNGKLLKYPEDWNEDSYPEDIHFTIGKIFQIGHFTNGYYKEYDLFTLDIEEGDDCEGKGYGCCTKTRRLRFTIKQGRIITFPLISNCSNEFLHELIVKAFGLEQKTDESFTIPLFEYPNTVFIKEKNVELTFSSENKVSITKEYLKKYRKVFFHNRLCQCYEFVNFIFFRPDGTALEYNYNPPVFSFTDIIGLKNETNLKVSDDLYDYDKNVAEHYCDDDYYQQSYTVYSAKYLKELKEIGTTKSHGKIYVYKNKDNKHLKQLFDEYKQSLSEIKHYYNDGYTLHLFRNDIEKNSFQKMCNLPYDQFVKKHPVLFWLDPFDRIIPVWNVSLSTPCMAEPIIYLYPKSEQKITIVFNK
ncbi:protein phosphatase 6 regulatory ankyrin repeat subunit A, partial [Candidatus Magnetomorum sp. HK-1]